MSQDLVECTLVFNACDTIWHLRLTFWTFDGYLHSEAAHSYLQASSAKGKTLSLDEL